MWDLDQRWSITFHVLALLDAIFSKGLLNCRIGTHPFTTTNSLLCIYLASWRHLPSQGTSFAFFNIPYSHVSISSRFVFFFRLKEIMCDRENQNTPPFNFPSFSEANTAVCLSCIFLEMLSGYISIFPIFSPPPHTLSPLCLTLLFSFYSCILIISVVLSHSNGYIIFQCMDLPYFRFVLMGNWGF